ncbi:acetylornithine aminotransferase, partial [Kappamyces sp. JEL0680]
AGPLLPLYARPSQLFVKGNGCYLTDQHGKTYLDFTSGIAVNALGHAHPKVVEIISDQAKKLIHLSNLYHNEYAEGLAQQIVDSIGSENEQLSGAQVFFCNSGTEANEGKARGLNVKYAKVTYPEDKKKIGVISFSNAFHGRTLGALSATPNPKYQKPFLPLMEGFKTVPFNDMASVDSIDESTCAVIMEPIQGEGGIHPASPAFAKAVRDKCSQVGALLIFDEVQCGVGRTGKLFGFENLPLPGTDDSKDAVSKSYVSPDIVTMAKPLAAGLPLGAVV